MCPTKNSVLVFLRGLSSQEIEVGTKTSVNVSLSPTVASLNEVVVVGYGTQKRKEVTSAVATVSAEQFNKGNISDVAQLLQGKVAGSPFQNPVETRMEVSRSVCVAYQPLVR
jgi:iron complex outermembrane receptor protein